MDQSRYTKYLVEYVKKSLDESDGTAYGAANYLGAQKKPGFLAANEKKEAFQRAKKVFSEMRDRPLWLVLKALGLTNEDLER
jgi:hypothetical protein